jgi:hypothetical protein
MITVTATTAGREAVPERELTLAEAGRRFGIARQTLNRAVLQGWLPARKVGDVWVVRPADIRRWQANPEAHRVGRPPRRSRRPQPRTDRVRYIKRPRPGEPPPEAGGQEQQEGEP